MRRMSKAFLCVATVALFLTLSQVFADPLPFSVGRAVSYEMRIARLLTDHWVEEEFGGPSWMSSRSHDTGVIHRDVVEDVGCGPGVPNCQGAGVDVRAAASADYGILRVYAHATGSVFSEDHYGEGTASASAGFADIWTINHKNPELNGTPGQLSIKYEISGSMISNYEIEVGGLWYSGYYHSITAGPNGIDGMWEISESWRDPPPEVTVSYDFIYGTPFQVSLEFTVSAAGMYGEEDTSVTADYLNTLTMTDLQVAGMQDGDWSLYTDSGHNYPVPAPATLLLLGPGLAAIAVFRKRVWKGSR